MMSKFTKTDIESLFAGMTSTTRQHLAIDLRDVLIPTIRGLVGAGPIVPRSDQIFNAFRSCPIENTSVVIIGPDPYHDGSATGLAFSADRNAKIPASLRNIYAALIRSNLMKSAPKHPDLSRWTSQGVLLLNTALTTAPKVAGAHVAIWEKYTSAVIKLLAQRSSPTAFVLWGAHAKKAMDGIELGQQHAVFEWGHPSPMSSVNRCVDDPGAFINCDSFTKVNAFRIAGGFPPVDWNVDEVAPLKHEPLIFTPLHAPILGSPLVLVPPPTLWIFTDGGAVSNGSKHCTATWAWYATDGKSAWVSRGQVSPVVIDGKNVPASNNRGELTALLSALTWASHESTRYSHIMVVSDSEYSIKAISVWFPSWKAKGALADKKNIDLIISAYAAYVSIIGKTTLTHTKSRQDEPADNATTEWFIWRGNEIVDKLCEQ